MTNSSDLAPYNLWSARRWNSLPGFALYATLVINGFGVARVWQHRGRNQDTRGVQIGAFTGGLFVLFVALMLPLDALISALFSAHMARHILLKNPGISAICPPRPCGS